MSITIVPNIVDKFSNCHVFREIGFVIVTLIINVGLDRSDPVCTSVI